MLKAINQKRDKARKTTFLETVKEWGQSDFDLDFFNENADPVHHTSQDAGELQPEPYQVQDAGELQPEPSQVQDEGEGDTELPEGE